ncbi:MAG: hypothetical protein J3K34DRAFT_236056 [Monoraphidium minutum]|nr:MAG: hypothetical protein J3K34DRAFT_236056 [Monoraphidium minutum]
MTLSRSNGRSASIVMLFAFMSISGFSLSTATSYRSMVDQLTGSNREHIYRYIALMNFFGAVDNTASLPGRASLVPRAQDRSSSICRTIGDFAVYMHDFGLEHFDVNFRKDQACWNGSSIDSCLVSQVGVQRGYTWWCNKRPNNPCVFNCPTQVR